MEPAYYFTESELLKHDQHIAKQTAIETVKAMWEKQREENMPEWVSIGWIVENHYCGIRSRSTYQRWRKLILRDDPEGKIIRKLPNHQPEINAKLFEQWFDQYKQEKNKDIRQRLGVV